MYERWKEKISRMRHTLGSARAVGSGKAPWIFSTNHGICGNRTFNDLDLEQLSFVGYVVIHFLT